MLMVNISSYSSSPPRKSFFALRISRAGLNFCAILRVENVNLWHESNRYNVGKLDKIFPFKSWQIRELYAEEISQWHDFDYFPDEKNSIRVLCLCWGDLQSALVNINRYVNVVLLQVSI